MKLSEYFRDKIYVIILHVICMVFLSVFLVSIGNPFSVVALVLILWVLILSLYFTIDCMQRKRYFNNLFKLAKKLDNRYLISEVMEKPYKLEDMKYYTLLRMANKSMLEEITKVKNERKEYKEYIEQWVHEIKTPISSIKLICENNKSEITRKILSELEKTDNFVEQALFYAKSEHVENDYLIKEISLEKCIHSTIVRNKQMFIQNSIKLNLKDIDKTVYSDSKWIEFIMNQLLINSVKYKNKEHPQIKIYTKDIKNGVMLVVEDNGIGILQSEMSRVFEKGFTGSNGRYNKKSTGIGLYLCKRLCTKLGLEIKITSKQNEYTRVSVFFPKGTLIKVQD